MLPPMIQYELTARGSGGIDVLEAQATKRIAIYGFWVHQSVSVSVNPTEEAKMYFGSDPDNKHQRIASYEQQNAGDEFGIALTGLNLLGRIGEPVTLKNAVYAIGELKTDAILYYGFV